MFPSDAGIVVPGTAYDVGPAGLLLGESARVQLSVPGDLLESAGDDLLLTLAILRQDSSIVTQVLSYDVENGILTAEIDELGPMAAVVTSDAIPVGTGLPPSLGGGSFPTPVGPPPLPGGPALTGHDVVGFSATCSCGPRLGAESSGGRRAVGLNSGLSGGRFSGATYDRPACAVF